jgi:hypothetical protein
MGPSRHSLRIPPRYAACTTAPSGMSCRHSRCAAAPFFSQCGGAARDSGPQVSLFPPLTRLRVQSVGISFIWCGLFLLDVGMENGTVSSVDRAGTCAATACAVHCIFAPFATLLPMVGMSFWKGGLSILLLGASLILAATSCWFGYRLHRHKRVPMAFLSGILILCVANLGFEGHAEVVASVMGAAFLVSGHWLNRRFCQACPRCG